MNPDQLKQQLQAIRNYYESGATRTLAFRKQQLQKLKAAIHQYEQPLYEALHKDLKRSAEESWVTELGVVMADINQALRNLRHWMQPQRVSTNLVNLPSASYILREPLGVVLIISPWNYPFQLLFAPMIGAIAAGNCIVLKPSELAPATAKVMNNIVREIFPPEYILYLEGDGAQLVPALMNNFRFNHVFYTGSTAVGKSIYQLAASQLVPVTLELGGKSPCVVESDANIQVAARRIAVTKFANAGQMCIAPDYVLVHTSKKAALIASLKEAIVSFYSASPAESYSYCKIINEKQFQRLIGYLSQGTIVHGGRNEISQLYIEPTILENVSPDSPLMKEEIFGPLLPVLTFNTLEEAKAIIQNNPDPLSFYIYTTDAKKEKEWLQAIPFGGGCVNNSGWHFTNHHLPFGGRGNSGIGKYHGKYSFEVFSNTKSVMKTPTWFDPAIKYPPFKGRLKLFKWVIK
ncbi:MULTISPECIES: aldehyde dehydrogenase [Niastella]|uniref:Aldehyde dehydrogenase n=1 Tax=Niastella soli TaxID=2821487 RepID=A0ABS3YQ35_9BACT|nr:aldehyde dehydrogenase [Niastella soli]MBO9200003.1 aldehyde dehydrogenase [Niastella soli]